MILADLVPAFQGISNKLIPGAIPAVDCAVFFPYAPTAVILGFVASFIGGVVGMFIVGATMGVFIIPGMVPHFFYGATAGIFGNATGGCKGAARLAPSSTVCSSPLRRPCCSVLSVFGFQNTTFGDFDFGVIGITSAAPLPPSAPPASTLFSPSCSLWPSSPTSSRPRARLSTTLPRRSIKTPLLHPRPFARARLGRARASCLRRGRIDAICNT